MDAAIKRCQTEIAAIEALLLAGHRTSRAFAWRCRTGRPSCASSKTNNAAGQVPGGGKGGGMKGFRP